MSKPHGQIFASHTITTKVLVGVISLVVMVLICTLPTFPRVAASNDRSATLVQMGDTSQTLLRRAHTGFSKKQAANSFTRSAGAKADNDVVKMYSDFCAFTLKERKALFSNASPNDKSDLWRTHLALFLHRPELNKRQKQIISAAMSLATAELFEVPANTPVWKTKVQVPLRALENQILAAFSLEEARKIFATLGESNKVGTGTLTPSESVSLNRINYWRLSDSVVQDPPSGPPCDCSTSDDWCPITQYCAGGSCSPTSSGCGTIWAYPCSGTCR